MAKRKDDVSFSFSSKKIEKKKPAAKVEEASAETPPEASPDPFATPTDSSADPFASSADAAADPFATPNDTSADPFAANSSDSASSDPFASSSGTDPFATPSEPAADPFASSTDTASADPFASADTSTADASAESTVEAPAEETAEEEPASKTPQIKEHKQFRVLILADFSGRANRGISNPADISMRKVLTVDSDSLDRTIAKVKPEIRLPVDEKTVVPLAFKAMEDFRPDSLLQRIEAFQGMLNLRGQLKDSKKFKEASAAVRKLIGAAPAKKAKSAKGTAAGGGEERGGIRILSG